MATPKYGNKMSHENTIPSLLVILLGRIFKASAKQSDATRKVEQVLQERTIKSRPAFISVLNTEMGEFGADGPLTDIYVAAQKAHDMQWPSLIILDALFDRQLRGEIRDGECKEVTAIIVYLKPSTEDQRPCPLRFSSVDYL